MATLHKILSAHDSVKFASEHGTQTHARLQRIIIDGEKIHGDAELARTIAAIPELRKFFSPASRTEVPIAGTVNGRFISRRIDRLLIDNATKSILILDYKTDVDCTAFRDKYVIQLREYATLLRAIYPDYKISAYILWTHDFLLEKLPIKPL